MKYIRIRCLACLLAMLLAVAALTPALAEEKSATDVSAILDWAGSLNSAGQSLQKKSNPSAAMMKFAADQQLSINASADDASGEDVAASFFQVWDYGVLSTALSEDKSVEQYATLVMIENNSVLLVTDAAMYLEIRQLLEGVSDEEANAIIASATKVLMPDGQGSYYELYADAVVFSSRMPLMFVLMNLNQDLGTGYANDPDGTVQDCAGRSYNEQTGEIGVTGDQLIPVDGLRSSLASGMPYMEGSPVYAVDTAARQYFVPAIGVQAADGYVYSAYQALLTLVQELSGESEPTDEPTDVPTQEPTDVPTEEPTDVPTEEPTDVPTEEPTDVPTEEPTEVPTEEPTEVPTEEPTEVPTDVPTEVPTDVPTDVPAEEPTEEPTEAPAAAPVAPENTPEPTAEPTPEPAKGGLGSLGELLNRKDLLYGAAAVVVILAALILLARKKKAKARNKASQAATPAPVAPVAPAKTAIVNKTAVAQKTTAADKTTVADKTTQRQSTATILCTSGTLAGARFPLTGKTYIGRDKRRCGIIFPANEPGISAVHCSVAPGKGGELILTDENSSQGTFVAGNRLTAGKTVRLRQGAAFSLGGAKKNTFVVE